MVDEQKKLILVVDDEPYVRRLIGLVVGKCGFRIVEAGSAEAAQAILSSEEQRPVLIMLDILMPGTDGLQFLKWLKDQSQLNNIPVIMLSSVAHGDVVKKGVELGAKDYIRKPFHPKDLKERVLRLSEAE